MAIIIGQQYEGIASWATTKAREFDDDSDDYLMIASADLPTLGLFDSDTPFTILATWYAGAFDDAHTLVGLWGGRERGDWCGREVKNGTKTSEHITMAPVKAVSAPTQPIRGTPPGFFVTAQAMETVIRGGRSLER